VTRFYIPTAPRKSKSKSGALALTSSTAALAFMMMAMPTHAQTSTMDGQTITTTTDATATAPIITIANNNVTVSNSATLSTTGVTQTVQVNSDTSGGIINNVATGIIEADSRAVNIDGDNVTLNNAGIIRGTGNQRNGTIYGNRTANGITIANSGTVDAGTGNQGAAIAIEVGGGGNPITGAINNTGTLQGRGQAASTGGTAGDGLRFFGPGLAPVYQYNGDITNSGTIASESAVGTTSGVRFANSINFGGTLTNSVLSTTPVRSALTVARLTLTAQV